ncbi:non-canonical purine NTP diphosphatase [Falsiporphyromonas endometrii]|uniref:dITP/XTP pyrophosphatase n=1 Tax=Falsiporphyromonas endometrii TaxID=1387297 RepID=A0ABV9K976_9PORP
MDNIVFATNNLHKLQEVRDILKGKYIVRSLDELGCHDDIPETADTLEGNALIKARYIYNKYHVFCFADDTGLEVEILDGAPGVYSARYAGEHCSPEDNRKKLLKALQDEPTPRKARFRTVIALIDQDGEHLFEGEVEGEITTEEVGSNGFGYDPIFKPQGYDVTFAQMSEEEKNKISHRGRAVAKLAKYFKV